MDLHPVLEQLLKLSPEVLNKILPELKINNPRANTAGAVLIGVFLARKLGIGKMIDSLVGDEYVTYEHLREESESGVKPRISTGLACEVLIGDMLGSYQDLTRLYKFEEACENWQVSKILGIPPEKFNDDKMGRALDAIGKDLSLMVDVLHGMALSTSQQYNIPLKRFYNDTSSIPVKGVMEDNNKVQYGYGGIPGLKQLVLNLTISAGASLPVTAVTDPGNVQGGTTFERTFEQVQKITGGNPFEIIIDRGILTHENMHLMLGSKRSQFIGPLKDELSRSWVLEQLNKAGEDAFFPISYRSKQEIQKNSLPHYQALETEYTFSVDIEPRKKGGPRRKKGERKIATHQVRAVIYRDLDKKNKDAKRRQEQIQRTQQALSDLNGKLNKRNLTTVEACQKEVAKIFKGRPDMRRLFNVTVKENQHGAVVMSWPISLDNSILRELAKTDGIFVLLTNHDKAFVDANELLTRYRGRNDIEMSFRFLKGALDLEQVFLRRPERVDAYCFLKVLAMFVINFAAWILEKHGKRLTPKKLQKEFGAMTIVEQRLEPMGIRRWVGANIPASIEILVNLFQLPHPVQLIEIVNTPIDYSQFIQEWISKNLA